MNCGIRFPPKPLQDAGGNPVNGKCKSEIPSLPPVRLGMDTQDVKQSGLPRGLAIAQNKRSLLMNHMDGGTFGWMGGGFGGGMWIWTVIGVLVVVLLVVLIAKVSKK